MMFAQSCRVGSLLRSPVLIIGVSIFCIAILQAEGLSFRSLSDRMTSVQAGNSAEHRLEYIAASQFSTSTIQVQFGTAVSQTNDIGWQFVHLAYGPSGNQVEYPVALLADDGVWGVNIDSATKILTLTYPTANGVPIAAGDRVTIDVGVDPSPSFPIATSTITLPTIRANSFTVSQQQQQQSATQQTELILQPVEGKPTIAREEKNPLQEIIPSLLSLDFAKARELIREQLSRIRVGIQQTTQTPQTTQVPPIVEPPVIKEEQNETGQIPAVAPSAAVVLPAEKAIDVNPEKETQVTLRREDGAGLDVLLPQQIVPGQGPSARLSVDRFSSIKDFYTVNIRPVTVAQAEQWTTLQMPGNKQIAPAQLYIVTAYKQADDQATAIQQFLNPITYVFRFTDEEIKGIDKRTLSAYSWDVADETLKKETSLINLEANTVTVTTNHLTLFTLAGDLKPGERRAHITIQSSVALVPVVSRVQLSDVALKKGESQEQIFHSDRDFTAPPSTQLSLCVPRAVFKKEVKQVRLTLGDTQSRLLLDPGRNCYSTALTTPKETGGKQLVLRIVYMDDQVQVIRYRASILPDFQVKLLTAVAPNITAVKKSVEIVSRHLEDTIAQSEPALQTTAIAAGPVVTALNPSLFSHAINWFHYLNHFISALLTALGLKRRRRHWGVAYDSITKRPIDLAIVRLFLTEGMKLVETQVTDKNGRFSFLAKPGRYCVSVMKHPYIFPSKIVKGQTDVGYTHVYHQEQFVVEKDDQVLDMSIPLDPQDPNMRVHHSPIKAFLYACAKVSVLSLFGSVALSIALAVYSPTTLNISLLFLNSIFMLIRLFALSRKERPWGTVFDAFTFQSIPLVAIGIIDAKAGKLLLTRLSDYEGRFSFLAPTGEYLLTAMKESYEFPPRSAPSSYKYKNVYLGGKLTIKKNKGTLKVNIPMEKKKEQPVRAPVILSQDETSSTPSKKRVMKKREASV